MKLVRRLLLAAPILLVVACGGAPEAARSPSSEPRDRESAPDRAPATIDEAQDQIADAQQTLLRDPSAPAADDAKASTEAAPAPPSSSSSSAGAPAKTKDAPVDVCMSPCRALASMRRAVEALCRMTGETDDRCTKARRTLETSHGRVTACRCAP